MTAPRTADRSRHVAALAFLFATATFATPAGAQRLADLQSGTQLRFRVNGDPDSWLGGKFVGVKSDSLIIQTGTQLSIVPRDRIGTVEWRDRDASRWPRALTGAGIGAIVLGTVTAIAAYQDKQSCEARHGSWCGFGIILVAPAAGVGVLVGGGIGALLPVERWRGVDSPPP
jgi:hypothetical protein